jgi:DNA-binding transcriptional ArsR family regulator
MTDDTERKVYEMKARVLRALAHPIRLAVVDFLVEGEQCVCDIAEQVGAQRSNVSRHLAVMVNAGVLESRKDGLKVIYRLRTPCVASCLACTAEVLREQIESTHHVLKDL